MAESIICRASSPFPEKTNFAKNWYFINPINSKGKKEYTEYGEIIDGWINQSWYTSKTPKTSYKLTDQGLLITPGEDISHLNQIIDSDLFNYFVGRYITITVVTPDGDQAVLTLIVDANSTMEHFRGTFQNHNGWYILLYKWGGWLGGRPNIQLCCDADADPIYLLGVCIEEGISSTFTYQDAEGKWRIKQPLPNRSLEMIRTNEGITKYGLQQNADIVGNPYFAHSYETVTDVPTSNSIGLETSAHWWAIKYFPNPNIGDGYGIQLAILQNSTKMKFRTSYGGTWLPWQEVYHNGNLNPDTIGAAWANHTHDVVALGGGKIISGTYTGDGATPNGTEVGVSNPRFINLGITPKAVLVLAKGINVTYNEGHEYCRGGMATTGSPAIGREGNYVLSVATNGFYVYKETKGSNWMSFSQTNEEGVLYNYIALI